jgi:hypothetical protein
MGQEAFSRSYLSQTLGKVEFTMIKTRGVIGFPKMKREIDGPGSMRPQLPENSGRWESTRNEPGERVTRNRIGH